MKIDRNIQTVLFFQLKFSFIPHLKTLPKKRREDVRRGTSITAFHILAFSIFKTLDFFLLLLNISIAVAVDIGLFGSVLTSVLLVCRLLD